MKKIHRLRLCTLEDGTDSEENQEKRDEAVLRGLAPSYLEELVTPYQPNRPLRSQNAGLLVVPRDSRSRLGGRAFSYQASLLWNQLPVQVLRGLAPSYLEELVTPYQPNRPLRSQNAGLLVVPRDSRSRLGGRAFSYQASLLWNQLPVQVREADSIFLSYHLGRRLTGASECATTKYQWLT
ncbi:hypothetical protein D4764_01G0018230 [Takifugu flavidus]|uniref:Uncharacterized protein n=1 Tax=Takifugu flavidus TaxID=433684 RepID=A0A5C6PT71_9TELE|nr:hypothetical protein D4764_01G0018230 [Takifugu flavidus]